MQRVVHWQHSLAQIAPVSVHVLWDLRSEQSKPIRDLI
jgi:hypothetical protein